MNPPADFESWLSAYGAAWEALDAEAYMPLFTDDAAYHWSPFDAPKRGHDEIRAALKTALERQIGPEFSFEIIMAGGDTGWAHWACGFIRAGTDYPVRIDGVLKARFAEDGRCCEFREWWHALEPNETDAMRAVDA